MGRKKEFENRITLPLSDEMLTGVDAVRRDGEDRLSVIRAAIEREIISRCGHYPVTADRVIVRNAEKPVKRTRRKKAEK